MPGDVTDLTAGNLPKGAGKLRLLTRDDLDGRTKARRLFDSIESGIIADLGGLSNTTTVEVHLASAFASAAVCLEAINTQLLSGASIDVNAHAAALSGLVRVAGRLPTGRRAKNVSPNLRDYIEGRAPA
jgi:hypothetical protein